jgi:acetyltransferase-like isoleucine patch superfamily enzyme
MGNKVTMMPLQVGSSTEDKAFARVSVAGLDTEGLVARGDAPDWLLERGNTVLALEGMPLPRFIPGPYTEGIATGGVAVLRSPGDYRIMLWGEDPLVSVGSHSCLDYGELRCGSGEIHISAQFTAAGGMEIDARNGGYVKIGKQSQCGPRVMILTDDMHTIRDMHSGKRVNPYGGRVVIGERVWMGLEAIIKGNADIGSDSVIGARSMATGVLPANSVCVGVPARPVRTEIVWEHADVPE